ncbi:hypothetical protein N657DRAFT_400457 [Parathielavia appendiculata]|uniref:Uncharacterized protein n=1 Tax=Parathielavia appendiculata TaxID=2587402 RepID=A0AAN6U1X9_9PEZI|nr:hypothetical protein N657DRAFT_400457 [Parathielavia appendiculata]
MDEIDEDENEDVSFFMPKGNRLSFKRSTWIPWLSSIRWAASHLGIWHIISLDEYLLTDDKMLGIPEQAPSSDNVRKRLIRKRQAAYDRECAAWLRTDPQERGPRPDPSSIESTEEMFLTEASAAIEEYSKARHAARPMIKACTQVNMLISSTVDRKTF